VGDIVDAVVLNIDVEKKRISLGMKQVEPNPWDVIEEKYPVGTTIEGRIKNITDFGVFIGIDEGIDGLVHISDISWTRRIKHPSEIYKKGQEVQAVVLNIDKENERFSLGIKQLVADPWDTIPIKYKPGTRVTGTVTNITDFGIFLELEEGIEGLVHVSEIAGDKHGNPLSRFQVDDVIQAKVINVSREEKKIGLSIRKMDETREKDNFKGFTNNNMEATSNLGDILREEMMNLQKNSSLDIEPGEEEPPNDSAPEEEAMATDEGAEENAAKSQEEEKEAETVTDKEESEGGESSDESLQEKSASA
jgi:small subunit ribosomal protein S1